MSENYLLQKAIKGIANILGSDTSVKDSLTNPPSVSQIPAEAFLAQDRTAFINLRALLTTLRYTSRTRPIRVLGDGTSISYGQQWEAIFADCLKGVFGVSKSVNGFFSPSSGWKYQEYVGKRYLRIKGSVADGASAITMRFTNCTSLGVKYSKNTDGGSCAVSLSTNGGAGVSQTAIDCNGAWSIGNVWKLTGLDPDAVYDLTISPPTSGYGYLQEYASLANDIGLVFYNASWGGHGMGNHAGTNQYTAGSGYYPTDTYVGTAGLADTFGDNDPLFFNDLVLMSGFTNDGSDTANFPTSIATVASILQTAGSVGIYGIEPINKSAAQSYRTTAWMTNRAAIYAAATTYKGSLFVQDWDKLMSSTIEYDSSFHQEGTVPGGDSVHPLQIAHLINVQDICRKTGVPFLYSQGRSYSPNNAISYSQAYEPKNAPLGSTWEDTSVSPSIKKKLISRQDTNGDFNGSGRGLWEVLNGSSTLIKKASSSDGGVWGTAWNGAPALTIAKGGSNFYLTATAPSDGATGTVSFVVEGSGAPIFSYSVLLGSGATAGADKTTGNFSTSGGGGTTYAGSLGDIFRIVLPFKMPSGAEKTALQAAGVDCSVLRLLIQPPNNGGSSMSVHEIRFDNGASMTTSI